MCARFAAYGAAPARIADGPLRQYAPTAAYGVAEAAPRIAAEPVAASTVAAGRPMKVLVSTAPNIAPICGVCTLIPASSGIMSRHGAPRSIPPTRC